MKSIIYIFFNKQVLNLVLCLFYFQINVFSQICHFVEQGVYANIAQVLDVEDNGDCTVNITVTRYSTQFDPACQQSGANAEACQNGFTECFFGCYQYLLISNNQIIENTCSDNETYTFKNVPSDNEYKVLIVYRHFRFCGSLPVCFILIDEANIQFSDNVCSVVQDKHADNQPSTVSRNQEIQIDCAFDDNQTTILRSASRIKSLPGSRSGTGSNTYVHASIGVCEDFSGGMVINDDIVELQDYYNYLVKDYTNDSLLYLSTERIKNSIYIYPNPTSGSFTVETKKSNLAESIDISVYDQLGRKVHQKPNAGSIEQLDLTEQGKGVYFIKIQVGNEFFNKKLVVQ